jgi:hypothetical protein
MNIGPIHVERQQQARMLRLKEAVLASFHEPAPSLRARLAEFTARDWERAKNWLDVSGLALYFLDQLLTLGLESCTPANFLNQLQKDFGDNCERTEDLFREAAALSDVLQEQKIEFALLKGITLPPESVHAFALRSQMDLDFLVRESDADRVKKCLANFGYSLHAVSGNTWEFKAGRPGTSTLKNLYQVRPERAIEMHLIAKAEAEPDRLERAQRRLIAGQPFPVLSPADLFVQQGQHLFKHMCSEFTRTSWVLEFWRHICARRNDAGFWHTVDAIADHEPGADLAIGAATLLTSLVFGPSAPQELSRWSMDRVPPAICLWIQLYGRRLLLADTPGSKLYLLLLKELNPHSEAESRTRRRLLFPAHRPPQITRAEHNEGPVAWLRRQRAQTRFVMRRLRFHVAEGAGLAIESLRWQRRVTGVSQ